MERMGQEWISSKYGVLVYSLTRSAHPAWVWPEGGEPVLWHNQAARWFHAQTKKGELRPVEAVRPIKGQIKRLLRLGFAGVTSLARVQMLVDGHPVSQTCRCTPIVLADGERALLCVSADALTGEALENASAGQPIIDRLLPHLGAYALVDGDNRVLSGSAEGIAQVQGAALAELGRQPVTDGLDLLVLPQVTVELPAAAETEPEVEAEAAGEPEVVEPAGEPALAETDSPEPVETSEEMEEPAAVEDEEQQEPEHRTHESGRLADLMERFESRSRLYEPLGPEDEYLPPELIPDPEATRPAGGADEMAFGPSEEEATAEDIEDLERLDGYEDDWVAAREEEGEQPEDAEVAPETVEPARMWRVTGRGFVPDEVVVPEAENEPETGPDIAEVAASLTLPAEADEELDQAARYNFDELARILTDRVAGESQGEREETARSAPLVERRSEARTLSLSDEHLVLNRLPLGILVFRDQEIVFANRAMADLLACTSIAELRERGLDAIFPRIGEPGVTPGPVATLLDSQGTQVPVSARLQSIAWHGGPALMLSARREDSEPSGEILVRNFVETLAAARDDGFIEISRAGVIEAASGRAADLLERGTELVIGRPLAGFIDPEQLDDFRAFLEKPARRAGTDRPFLQLRANSGAALDLFTEGSAGIVTGYFGIVSAEEKLFTAPAPGTARQDHDTSIMAKMSRGLRRPLNTIIGFAQLLENQAFGPLGHARYLEYARDIRSAGREVEGLVDEFDQYSGLQNESILADASDFSLEDLLTDCESVVRDQAGRRQVFVRSAISENLPYIRADRVLMRQALLNLLASAIDQTPQGGKVILSAQVEDDGGVSVHVRDSGSGHAEHAERFAVFREGTSARGEAMVPMKSSIGLALTRSLVAANACRLDIDPSSGTGTVMSLHIPADLVRTARRQAD